MSGKVFIAASVVAQELGVSRETFLRKRIDMQNDLGFPPPMPHTQRPMLWRAAVVRAWIDRHGQPETEAPQPIPTGGNVVLMQEALRA